MDYRGAWKDGTYGSKNRNQSHWLKAAWPEKRESTWPAGCWRAELPGSSMSTCLPLPPPDSRLSLSLFLISLSLLLYVSLSSSFSCFSSSSSSSRGFVHLFSKGARRAHALVCAAATFILGPCTKPIRGESFHANSPENAFVVRRGNALVPNSFPHQNRDASSDRSKATHPRVSSLL